MTEGKKALLEAVDRNRVVEIASELIARESEAPPGNERAAAEYAERFLNRLGLKVRRQFCTESRFNVYGELAGEKPGRQIFYCGHLDVVNAEDHSRWSSPPYSPQVRGSRLYGRGACDMKGSIASLLHAAELLAPHRKDLRGMLGILLDVDEEHNNLGLKKWLEAPFCVPDLVVVGEPTGLSLDQGHRGVMAFRVTVTGESAHASRHREAQNAVLAAARLVALADGLDREMAGSGTTALGSGSIAATMIHGGTKVNTIPRECVVDFDVRITAGENAGTYKDRLERLLKIVEEETGCSWSYKVTTYCPSGLLDAGHPLLKEVRRSMEDTLETPAKISVFGACCEAGFFLERGIPALVLGPGRLEQAHNTDEYIEVDQLAEGARVYLGVIYDLLSEEG